MTPTSSGGKVSITLVSPVSSGPRFATTMLKVKLAPGSTLVTPSLFVISRSASVGGAGVVSIKIPSTFSPPKRLAEPSQKRLKLQLVLGPREPGTQTKISSSAPLTPLALKSPLVVR